MMGGRTGSVAWVLTAWLAGSGVATAAPLVLGDDDATDAPRMEAVKRRGGGDSGGGGGEDRGIVEYLKLAFTFSDESVARPVEDGRLIEHLLGGLLTGVGGHIWAPYVAYKDINDRPQSALILGIIGTAVFWLSIIPFFFSWVYGIGFVIGCITLTLAYIFNFWFIPRAIQFAYSDAYGGAGSGGGGGSKRKRSRRDDDDDDE